VVLGVIAAATAFFGYRRANGAFEVISFSILLALGLAVHTYVIRNNENPFVAFVRKRKRPYRSVMGEVLEAICGRGGQTSTLICWFGNSARCTA